MTYTIFRILLAPFSLKNSYEEVMMYWDRRNGFENTAVLSSFGLNIVLTAMNVYWYYFIIRLVFKPFFNVT